MKGLVSNIQRYSVSDGPGIRTTVFLKGCPLACKWCHNPESMSSRKQLVLRGDRCIGCGECLAVCEAKAITRSGSGLATDRARCVTCGRCVEVCYAGARELAGCEMATGDVMEEVLKDRVFCERSGGGVTFSGGEPFHQPGFLLSLLKASRAEGIHTAVDTSGYAPQEVLNEAEGLVDLFLFDLKTRDDARHKDFTGVSNRLILENLRRLAGHQNTVIVRVPVIPGFNDDATEICRIGALIADIPGIDEVHLLPYHRSGIDKYRRLGLQYDMEVVAEPSREKLETLARELAQHVATVVLGG
jgi:pyruvate formate lyase activating enzyme